MKKLLLLCALSAVAGNLYAAARPELEGLSVADLVEGMDDAQLMSLLVNESQGTIMPFGMTATPRYKLVLEGKGITDITGLSALRQRLQELLERRGKGERLTGNVSLARNVITELNPAAVEGLDWVLDLDLRNNHISHIAPGTFSGVWFLQLNLSNNKIQSVGPELLGANFDRLYLFGNPIKSVVQGSGVRTRPIVLEIGKDASPDVFHGIIDLYRKNGLSTYIR